MQARAREWPQGMTATATHDTKRGEDARARITSLSEIPGEWSSAVSRWKVLNAPHLALHGNLRAPSATFEYMLYQTLLGAWPLAEPADAGFVERIQAYALKAAREGKEETSWLNPHESYEEGIKSFVAKILDPALSGEFLESLQALARRVALLGALNGLSQLTLKATLPGVPDFYQGTEFWDLSLVDPDNRRPVDFAARHASLGLLDDPDWRSLITNWPDGRLKLAWTRHLLKLRSALSDVFTRGDYQPLDVRGAHADHVVAFARRHGHGAAIVVVGRQFVPFTQAGREWPAPEGFDATVDITGYTAAGLVGNELPLAQAFRDFPAFVIEARVASPIMPARQKAGG
jgi:(1->4)-alpha-D-glucan 1-alpha-D-glucosylmutase